MPWKDGSRVNYLFLRVPSRSSEFTKVAISTECSRAHKSNENLCERNAITFSYFACLCLSQIEILNAHVFAQGRRINETANKVSPSKTVKCQDSNNFLITMMMIALIIVDPNLRPTPLLTLSWNFYSHEEHHFVKKGGEGEVPCASNRCENAFLPQ